MNYLLIYLHLLEIPHVIHPMRRFVFLDSIKVS